jgi:putative solute:sodium symporter small subunit
LHTKGARAVDFLIKKVSLFGFDGQYWMLAGAALVAFFIIIAWRSRDNT